MDSYSYKAKVNHIIFKKENPNGDIFYILSVTSNNNDAVNSLDDVFGSTSKPYTVKGSSNAVINPGIEIEFTGKETKYKGQTQVVATYLKPSIAMTTRGALGWLLSKPVKGVGEKAIRKLEDAFPSNLADALKDPIMLVEQANISKKQAESLADAWMCVNVPSEILELFTLSKMTPSLISKCLTKYGSRLSDVIKDDPWRLAIEVSGMGFKSADTIAKELGLNLEHQSRYEAAIRHIIVNDLRTQGHTGITEKSLLQQIGKLGIRGSDKVKEAVEAALGRGYVAKRDTITKMIFDPEVLREEKEIGKKISTLLETDTDISHDEAVSKILRMENFNGLILDESQRQAAARAITNSVSIITGGPGTGKSTTQKIILDVLQREPDERILLLAPTGRAAKRLSEATGKEAFTIHRALGFDSEIFGFQHHSKNPLKASTIIVDEFSMVDNHMAYSLTQAIGSNARLIIVGDDQQLPSVSQGQVLADFIRSDAIPTARLNVIHRQAEESGIIKAAHQINNQEIPEVNDKDVFFFESNDEKIIKDKVLNLIKTELPKQGYDINEDVMILTPMRKNTLGSWALNEIIKETVNPAKEKDLKHSVQFRDKWWSVGDKVMQLRNDYEKEVFNGTIGIVEKIEFDDDEAILVVDFGDIVARYTEKEINDLDHCWASTVHKVQGSETRVAAIITHMSHSFMLNKNLVYTGATRPKEQCIFIGDKRAMQTAVNKTDATERNTSLRHQIRKYNNLEIDLNEAKDTSNTKNIGIKIKTPKLNFSKM